MNQLGGSGSGNFSIVDEMKS